MSRREVIGKLRLQGLHCSKQAADMILTAMNEQPNAESFFQQLLVQIKQANLKSTMVSGEIVEKALQCVGAQEAESTADGIKVISAFETPKFQFDPVRKTFSRSGSDDVHTLLEGSLVRPMALRERFELVKLKTLNNKLFSPPVVGEQKQNYFPLEAIGSLKNGDGLQRVLGMITQPKEGVFALEDMNDAVPLDLTNAAASFGLFTESCIVVAEGEMVNDVFVVKGLAMPPSEDRAETLRTFPVLAPFMTPATKKIEEEATGYQFLFLSDVWLDRPKVVQGLVQLLSAYDGIAAQGQMAALILVLCGNFTAVPLQGHAELEKLFGELGAIMSGYTNLLEVCSVVVIPGMDDPSAGQILPRPPLPSSVAAAFQQSVPNSLFTSNPCRIQFFSQEIVIVRNDICQKMRRFSRRPDADVPIWKQVARSLIDQAHLCPLPPRTAPVYWSYDYTLRLYPTPTILIAADRVAQCSTTWCGCTVANPGSFSTDLSFLVYTPSTKSLDTCQIDEAPE